MPPSTTEPGSRAEALLEDAPSRYVVGIDLGTTNSAVAYVDTKKKKWAVHAFTLKQLVGPGEVDSRRSLPSFLYQSVAGEFEPDALALPWDRQQRQFAVGSFARDHGTLSPARLISSAKSWLCHTGVDRTSDLLPWQGASDIQRLSPVDVSARYLSHIRDTWDHEHPDFPLADQDIALTLPASFDEVARELTVEAAARAGLNRVVLIEEPQAAFYAWINANRQNWETLVQSGQKILVCDVGGGTSDFTLIRVRRDDTDKVVFHRVAVGDHLILGGDNLDLALAHHVEERLLDQGRLEPRQWAVLVGKCRDVKESLLADNAPEKLTVTLPGSGTKLIGGSLQIEVTRQEVHQILVDGFLPHVQLDDQPRRRSSGFQEFGLPYAPDPAITRYLASFLCSHRNVTVEGDRLTTTHDPARPDVVLFNGGLFESPVLRDRMTDVLASWFEGSGSKSRWRPTILKGDDLDLAVARGAAYYGMVRRGQGVRIAAGLARTYYIGVQSDKPSAVCLLPATAQPGQEIQISEHQFHVLLSEPVEFPLFVSSTRLTDRAGELIEVDPEKVRQLPPVRTVLRARRKSDAGERPVHLYAQLNEIGTVDLWCREADSDNSWRIQFDVRAATQTDLEGHEAAGETEGFVDEQTWDACNAVIEATFGQHGGAEAKSVFKSLTAASGMDRSQWPVTLLRRMWDRALQLESGRRKSAAHEARWLNLLGYTLRPGFGVALDDWRVAETWRRLQGRLAHGTAACRTESWILWRRIAGGLGPGQQRAIAEPLISSVRATHRRTKTGRGRGGEVTHTPQESVEMWRLLGSLELLDLKLKIELGQIVLDLIPKPKQKPARSALAWALGRLGTRVPVYGTLNRVVPTDVILPWIEGLMHQRQVDANDTVAIMQMTRRTGDRYRDIPDSPRADIVDWLLHNDAPDHMLRLVRDGGHLDQEEQGSVFGEALPVGLRID